MNTLGLAGADHVVSGGAESAHGREGVVVFVSIEEIGIGDRAFLERRGLRVDGHEFVGVWERQRIPAHAVDYREKGAVCADSQGERQNGDRRETGILCQYAQSIADVLPKAHHGTLSSGPPTAARASGDRNDAAMVFVS